MTEADLIAEMQGRGYTDVCVKSVPIDGGTKTGVVVTFTKHNLPRRQSLLLPAGIPVDQAYPVLLGWAT